MPVEFAEWLRASSPDRNASSGPRIAMPSNSGKPHTIPNQGLYGVYHLQAPEPANIAARQHIQLACLHESPSRLHAKLANCGAQPRSRLRDPREADCLRAEEPTGGAQLPRGSSLCPPGGLCRLRQAHLGLASQPQGRLPCHNRSLHGSGARPANSPDLHHASTSAERARDRRESPARHASLRATRHAQEIEQLRSRSEQGWNRDVYSRFE
mmetsp:Transcript_105846/g.273947  ORF Transcript_105846/g.273947 Transcript_105846/m.273947 type:complete len:211 (+) Transcript_105846:242-874(+)